MQGFSALRIGEHSLVWRRARHQIRYATRLQEAATEEMLLARRDHGWLYGTSGWGVGQGHGRRMAVPVS